MRLLSLLLCLALLTGCASKPSRESEIPVYEPTRETLPAPAETAETQPTETLPPETLPPDPVEVLLGSMTVEEKVGQLFLARCNAASALTDIGTYHLGGFVLFGVDIKDETPDSLRSKLSGYQSASRIPLLLAVDEEGGTVTRVSRYSAFRSENFPSPRTLFEQLGYEAVLQIEDEKSQLLSSLGFNVNLGPVCDITTEPSSFMYKRSLGQSPTTTSRFIMDTVAIMDAWGVGSALKHFPGYGNNSDTHTGIARDSRSLQELIDRDLIPFQAGINSGCGAILVSHTIVEAMDDQLPASLSPAVHTFLRQDMGFEGVILTDDLVMQAITDCYGAGEAAVLAVLAGNDLLCSSEYALQYEAVLAAVLEGRIPMEKLDFAAGNVLRWKARLGLIE